MLTGGELLKLPLASSVTTRCNSLSSGHSQVFPHRITKWKNFSSECRDRINGFDFGPHHYHVPDLDPVELVREASVGEALFADVFRRVNRVLRHHKPEYAWIAAHRLAARPGFLQTRTPDAALKITIDDRDHAIVIGKWNLVFLREADDLVDLYNHGVARVQHPIGQATEYVLMTGCKYVIMSSFKATWFAKAEEVNGEICMEITDPYLFDCSEPSVNEGVFHISMLANMDPGEGLPEGGLRGQSFLTEPPRRSGAGQIPAPVSTHAYQTRTLGLQTAWGSDRAGTASRMCLSLSATSLSLGHSLGSGSGGVIVEGVFEGKEVAIKMASPEEEEYPQRVMWEMRNELNAYEFMFPIQGTCIPYLYGYGEVNAVTGHRALILILERIHGSSLGSVTLSPAIGKAAQKPLAAIHTSGVAHGDVAKDNMMLVAGASSESPKIMFVDFGRAVVGASPERIREDAEDLFALFADEGVILQPVNSSTSMESSAHSVLPGS